MSVENILILVCTVVATLGFGTGAVAYMRLAPWYEEPIGRWFVGLLLVLTTMLGLLTVNRALNREITRTVWVFLAVTLATVSWGIAVTIIRTQRETNHED